MERKSTNMAWRRVVALFFCSYTIAFGWSFLRSLLKFELSDALLALLLGTVFFITGCIALNWFDASTWLETRCASIPGLRNGEWTASMSFFLVAFVVLALLGGTISNPQAPSDSIAEDEAFAEGTTAPVTTNPYEANDEDDDSVYVRDTETYYDGYDDYDGYGDDSASAGCGSNDGDPDYDEDNDRDNDGLCDE